MVKDLLKNYIEKAENTKFYYFFKVKIIKFKNYKIPEINNPLDYNYFVTVDCTRYSENLALLSRSVFHVSVLNLFLYCIDIEVSINDISFWKLTGFYG